MEGEVLRTILAATQKRKGKTGGVGQGVENREQKGFEREENLDDRGASKEGVLGEGGTTKRKMARKNKKVSGTKAREWRGQHNFKEWGQWFKKKGIDDKVTQGARKRGSGAKEN